MDHRERPSGLVDLLAGLWPQVAVGTLVVGDVRIGKRVIVERKTVHDLVQSVGDGRLFRQLWALCGECPRPLLIVEGPTPLPVAGLDAESLRGVLLGERQETSDRIRARACVRFGGDDRADPEAQSVYVEEFAKEEPSKTA